MHAKLKIEMDNAAFGGGGSFELARILAELAQKLREERGRPDGCKLRDYNGNTVGALEVFDDERQDAPPPVRIVAEIRGGCLVACHCSDENANFTLLDRDNLENDGEPTDPETNAKSLAALEQEIKTLTDVS